MSDDRYPPTIAAAAVRDLKAAKPRTTLTDVNPAVISVPPTLTATNTDEERDVAAKLEAYALGLTGTLRGNKFSLPKKGSVLLGRGLELTIRVPHERVSRQHARIDSDGFSYRIYDLESTNRTKVNGQPLAPHEACTLMNGDAIVLADAEAFRFLWAPPAGYCSAFISYGGPDELFAFKLYEHLLAYGVEAFFFPEAAELGQRIHEVMWTGVRKYDRIVLICSQHSLTRPGVVTELNNLFDREAQEGTNLLVPIMLDDYVLSAPGLAERIRARVIGNFKAALQNETTFRNALGRLLRSLERKS